MMGNEQNNKFVYSEECDSLLEDALKTEGITETLQKFFYIISLYPNCDFAYYEIGIYFKNSGLYKDAIKYFEKAEEINSNFDEYFAELGFCYEAIKKYKKAEYYYKKAFEINGKNPNTRYYWADYLVNTLKDYGQAEKIIEDLVFEYPENADYHRLYADVIAELGDVQRASDEYKKALAISPEDEFLLNNYGTFLLNNGETEIAKIYFKKAIEINPNQDLYKENLYFAIKSSTKLYKLQVKYLNKIFGPILDKPVLVTFLLAIWFPVTSFVLKCSMKYFEHVGNMLIYKLTIVLTLLLVVVLLILAVAQFITFVLIKLKIIK